MNSSSNSISDSFWKDFESPITSLDQQQINLYLPEECLAKDIVSLYSSFDSLFPTLIGNYISVIEDKYNPLFIQGLPDVLNKLDNASLIPSRPSRSSSNLTLSSFLTFRKQFNQRREFFLRLLSNLKETSSFSLENGGVELLVVDSDLNQAIEVPPEVILAYITRLALLSIQGKLTLGRAPVRDDSLEKINENGLELPLDLLEELNGISNGISGLVGPFEFREYGPTISRSIQETLLVSETVFQKGLGSMPISWTSSFHEDDLPLSLKRISSLESKKLRSIHYELYLHYSKFDQTFIPIIYRHFRITDSLGHKEYVIITDGGREDFSEEVIKEAQKSEDFEPTLINDVAFLESMSCDGYSLVCSRSGRYIMNLKDTPSLGFKTNSFRKIIVDGRAYNLRFKNILIPGNDPVAHRHDFLSKFMTKR